MIMTYLKRFIWFGIVCLIWGQARTDAQQPPNLNRQFPVGTVRRTTDLPRGRVRDRLEKLPVAQRERALQWLRRFHFTELDLQTLQIDSEGGVYYEEPAGPAPTAAATEPVIAEASVPVSPF